MHHPTDRTAHIPDVEHWSKREIAGPPSGIDPKTYHTPSGRSTTELCPTRGQPICLKPDPPVVPKPMFTMLIAKVSGF